VFDEVGDVDDREVEEEGRIEASCKKDSVTSPEGRD